MTIYDEKKNIFWVHIPKCAGSSIREAIWNDPEGEMHNHHHLWQLAMRVGAEKLNNAYGFTVVRNPYDRLVSAYYTLKTWHGLDNYATFDEFILNDFVSGTKNKLNDGMSAITSGANINIVYSQSRQGMVCHWRPQSDFVLHDKVNFDMIIRFENLAKEWPILCSRIGHYDLPIKNIGNRNKDWREYYASYTKEKKKVVMALYEQDFKNFNYSTEIL